MQTYKTTWDGYALECVYEYEAPQAETETDPPYEGCVSITQIYVNGSQSDAYDLINPRTIQCIEIEILEGLQ